MDIIAGGHLERALRNKVSRRIRTYGSASAADIPDNAVNLKPVFGYLEVMQQMAAEGLLEFEPRDPERPEPWLQKARFKLR